jgi:CheY-like chemotaxis protein
MAALWIDESTLTALERGFAATCSQSPRRQKLPRDHRASVVPLRASWRDLQVLVVSEHQRAAYALVRQLRRWGHLARRARPRAARRLAAEVRFDVVLLDLSTQQLETRPYFTRLRNFLAKHDCFVIAFAGRGDDEQQARREQAGVELLLHTPVEGGVVETLLLLEFIHVNRLLRSGETRPSQPPGPLTRTDGENKGKVRRRGLSVR